MIALSLDAFSLYFVFFFIFIRRQYSIGWDECILVVFFAFSLHSCTVLGGMIAFNLHLVAFWMLHLHFHYRTVLGGTIAFFCIFITAQYWVG